MVCLPQILLAPFLNNLTQVLFWLLSCWFEGGICCLGIFRFSACYFWCYWDFSKVLYKFPADIYLFKIDNENSRKVCEICSQLTIKAPERSQWRRSDVFIVNFQHILLIVLVCSLFNFEQVNAGWIAFPKVLCNLF